MKNIYIASCVENGGIYRYKADESGKLIFAEKTNVPSPMYMAIKNKKMYVVLRAPFDDKNSGVVEFDINSDGSLTNMSRCISTMGEVACHIATNGEDVYCANYISGSFSKLPDVLVTHSGNGPHPTRQLSPHPHFVGFTPDNKYLCVVDLGLDSIFVYNKNLSVKSVSKVPDGHGARHIVFSDDGKYMFCTNELKSTMSAFKYDDGILTLVDTKSGLSDENAVSTAAAIRIYKDKILMSNRGHDSISVFSFENEKLYLEKNIPCMGRCPRDFDIADDYIICANEESDTVTVLDCKNDYNCVDTIKVERVLNIVKGE